MNDYYTGQNVVVAVVGAVDHDEVVRQAEQHFSSLDYGTPNNVPDADYLGGIHSEVKDFQQSTIILGFPCSTLKENYFVDSVAASLLGGGMSSPLFDEVREKRGLVYGVGCFALHEENYGQFLITAGTSPEKVEEYTSVVATVLKEARNDLKDEDLQRAINTICVDLVRSQEKPFKYLRNQVESLFIEGRTVSVEELLKGFREVTKEQVKERMTSIFSHKPTISVVGPMDHGEELVEKLVSGIMN